MRTFAFLFLLSASYAYSQTTVSGVNYDRLLVANKEALVLNGAGIRNKWFIDLYTAGLYIKQKNNKPEPLINCNCTQAFKIVFVSSLITSDRFSSAIDEVFEKSTQGNTSAIDDRIDQFKTALGANLKMGDELLLIYNPKKGLEVHLNGKHVDTIPGFDFKKELMKLWIGPRPVNNSLKDDLLGL